MKWKWLFLLGASLIFNGLSAQIELKGRVLDADTKEPIVDANVYLDGTTLGTATDSDGQFLILVPNVIHTNLVVSYISYEQAIFPEPFKKLPEVIYLKEKAFGLNETVVKSGKPTFSEKQKMKAFREQFLGRTEAGKRCIILNENVIRLVYDPETEKLHGYADAPINIQNRHLGYNIRWELFEFTLTLNEKKSLASHNIDSVSIIGTAFFEEMPVANDVSWQRLEVYKFSKNRFFKVLKDNTIEDSDFRLFENETDTKRINRYFPASRWFRVSRNPEDKTTSIVTLNPAMKDSIGITGLIVSNVTANKATRERVTGNGIFRNTPFRTTSLSRFYFAVDTFNVDKYGNTDIVRDLFILGTIGHHRVGDTLPLDYLPPD